MTQAGQVIDSGIAVVHHVLEVGDLQRPDDEADELAPASRAHLRDPTEGAVYAGLIRVHSP